MEHTLFYWSSHVVYVMFSPEMDTASNIPWGPRTTVSAQTGKNLE